MKSPLISHFWLGSLRTNRKSIRTNTSSCRVALPSSQSCMKTRVTLRSRLNYRKLPSMLSRPRSSRTALAARRRRRVHFEGGKCHDGFRGGQKPRLKVTPAFGEESLQKAAASARRRNEERCLRAAHRAPRPRNPVSEPRMGPLVPSSSFDWHGLALWAEQVDALPFWRK